MSRINCHSAFQHYDMFHSRHCGGNYGSVFNTTYNINCSGHNGGFWGGFGLGLGNAFGSIFGSMFGGGMFGSFGFPMFGGGMFGGFPSWNNSWNLSGLWGNREKKADKSDEAETPKKEVKVVHEACNDPDLAKINGFTDRVQGLRETFDAKKAEDLKKEIEDAMKNQDDTHKAENTAAYQNLLDDLNGLSSSNPTIQTPNTQIKVNEAQNPAANQNTENKSNEIETANSFDRLPEYSTLSDADKKKYLDKCLELAKSLSPEDLQAQIAKLPDDVRVKVKQSFYENGYKNVKPEELTEELLKKLVSIIDKSEIDDFDNIKVLKTTKSGENKWTVGIKSNESGAEVSYVQVEIVDGELIFHGKQENQKYVLQKDSSNKLHLMQYKYHNGYGTADVSNK